MTVALTDQDKLTRIRWYGEVLDSDPIIDPTTNRGRVGKTRFDTFRPTGITVSCLRTDREGVSWRVECRGPVVQGEGAGTVTAYREWNWTGLLLRVPDGIPGSVSEFVLRCIGAVAAPAEPGTDDVEEVLT